MRQEQLSTQTTVQTSATPSIVDSLDIPGQTPSTTTVRGTTTVTATANSRATTSTVFPPTSRTTTTTTGSARSTTNRAAVFRRHNSTGTDGVFTYVTSNSSSEDWRAPSDADDYYYTADTNQTEAEDPERTGLLTSNNETDAETSVVSEDGDDEGSLLMEQLITTDAVLNVSGSEEMANGSLTAEGNERSADVDHSQSQVRDTSTTSTASPSPSSTAWLLAELPPDSDSGWPSGAHGSDEPRESASPRHGPVFPPLRLGGGGGSGGNWRLLPRPSRPARRRTAYRQMLASPFVAGGGATTERERKRALLHAFLLSRVAAAAAGKDLSLRRAMSASVFYRPKPPATAYEHDESPRQTEDVETAGWTTAAVQDTTTIIDLVTGTESPNNSSSTWRNADSSTSLIDRDDAANNRTSTDNATANSTSPRSAARLHQASTGRAAAAAVVIPIIVGFLESLTRKQFSWLDLTLAVCGTAAAVLGLINAVVFVVHVMRRLVGYGLTALPTPITAGYFSGFRNWAWNITGGG